MQTTRPLLLVSIFVNFCGFAIGFQIDANPAIHEKSRTFLPSQRSMARAPPERRDDEDGEPQTASSFGSGLPWSGFDPIQELSDMLRSMDDVIDDFMNKRMGNGEVFYGKREFKPSGKANTDGKYNGMGLTDKARIDAAREARQSAAARRRQE